MLMMLSWLLLSADMTAAELVAKSIAYHDPHGVWPTFQGTLITKETRPNGQPAREVELTFDLAAGEFEYDGRFDGHVFSRILKDGKAVSSLDGRTDLTDEERKQYRLSEDRVHWFFRYYRYLYGMPMNLRDPGTLIDPVVQETTFMDEDVLAICVAYDEAVGSDIWYFYFDPANYALVGMRFYKSAERTGGEYIILDDEIQVGDMRLPKQRRWYMNADDRHLGNDIIEGYRQP